MLQGIKTNYSSRINEAETSRWLIFFRTFEQGESRRMQQPGGRKNAMILRWGFTLSPFYSEYCQ